MFIFSSSPEFCIRICSFSEIDFRVSSELLQDGWGDKNNLLSLNMPRNLEMFYCSTSDALFFFLGGGATERTPNADTDRKE